MVWDTPPPLKPHQYGAYVVHHDGDDDARGQGGAPYMRSGLMGAIVMGLMAPLEASPRCERTPNHHAVRHWRLNLRSCVLVVGRR